MLPLVMPPELNSIKGVASLMSLPKSSRRKGRPKVYATTKSSSLLLAPEYSPGDVPVDVEIRSEVGVALLEP
jgi:hypothetical protein